MLFDIPEVDLGARDSGPMTLADAVARQRVDNELAWFIGTCRRTDSPGAVYSMSADQLYITASAFACRDSDAAQRVIDETREHSRFYGQARDVAVDDRAVVRALAPPGTHPDRVQIRYRSGYSVVTVDVRAMNPFVADQHALDLWYFATRAYPIS